MPKQDDFSKFKQIRAWLDMSSENKNEKDAAKPSPKETKTFGGERRATDRVRNVELTGWVKHSPSDSEAETRASFSLVPTRIIDISPTGASIRSKDYIKSGQRLHLNLKLKPSKTHDELIVKILCEVVHCVNTAKEVTHDLPWNDVYNIGLRFVDMDNEQKKLLDEFLKSKSEQ